MAMLIPEYKTPFIHKRDAQFTKRLCLIQYNIVQRYTRLHDHLHMSHSE